MNFKGWLSEIRFARRLIPSLCIYILVILLNFSNLNIVLLMLLKQVRTQQIHEMKKKEKDYIKLQV